MAQIKGWVESIRSRGRGGFSPDNLLPKCLRRYVVGWRCTMLNYGFLIICILLINFVFTVSVLAREGWSEGLGTLYEGDCPKVNRSNMIAHIFINAMSAILLSGGNFCMQSAIAPNRKELDLAHSRRQTSDVGIPSLKNIFRISRKRQAMWLTMAVSSVPLHLCYNSVIFATQSANNYGIILANEGFVRLPATVLGPNATAETSRYVNEAEFVQHIHRKAASKQLERLENRECIKAYAKTFVSSRSNLILVSETFKGHPNANFSWHVVGMQDNAGMDNGQGGPFDWLCNNDSMGGTPCGEIQASQASATAPHWRPFTCEAVRNDYDRISYCLSEVTESKCRLVFSPTIAITTILFNVAKLVVIGIMVYKDSHFPLLTMGDALVSFLERADTTLVHYGLFTNCDFEHCWTLKITGYSKVRKRWYGAPVSVRLYSFILIMIGGIGLCGFLLALGLGQYHLPSRSFDYLRNLGLGSIRPETMIINVFRGLFTGKASNGRFARAVVLANLPQPLLSLVYLLYNSLFTCMYAEHEWSQLAHQRKGLRVSGMPKGTQRSSHFLTLPWKFGIPILGLSAVLHWLVSQALFIIAIDRRGPLGLPANEEPTPWSGRSVEFKHISLGWSPIALIVFMMICGCMPIPIVILGLQRYKSGPPRFVGNSAVLAAACLVAPDEDGSKIAQGHVQWGVVRHPENGVAGHCALSGLDRPLPEEGLIYD